MISAIGIAGLLVRIAASYFDGLADRNRLRSIEIAAGNAHQGGGVILCAHGDRSGGVGDGVAGGVPQPPGRDQCGRVVQRLPLARLAPGHLVGGKNLALQQFHRQRFAKRLHAGFTRRPQRVHPGIVDGLPDVEFALQLDGFRKGARGQWRVRVGKLRRQYIALAAIQITQHQFALFRGQPVELRLYFQDIGQVQGQRCGKRIARTRGHAGDQHQCDTDSQNCFGRRH